MVLKATVFPEWNSDWLVPYYHYVVRPLPTHCPHLLTNDCTQPIQMDYSDLYSTVLFFAGTPDGKNAHDELAEEIAQNGRKFVAEYWRWADMESYVSHFCLSICSSR